MGDIGVCWMVIYWTYSFWWIVQVDRDCCVCYRWYIWGRNIDNLMVGYPYVRQHVVTDGAGVLSISRYSGLSLETMTTLGGTRMWEIWEWSREAHHPSPDLGFMVQYLHIGHVVTSTACWLSLCIQSLLYPHQKLFTSAPKSPRSSEAVLLKDLQYPTSTCSCGTHGSIGLFGLATSVSASINPGPKSKQLYLDLCKMLNSTNSSQTSHITRCENHHIHSVTCTRATLLWIHSLSLLMMMRRSPSHHPRRCSSQHFQGFSQIHWTLGTTRQPNF